MTTLLMLARAIPPDVLLVLAATFFVLGGLAAVWMAAMRGSNDGS